MSLARLIRWGGLALLLVAIASLEYVWLGAGHPARVARRISAAACFQQAMQHGLPGTLAEMRLGNSAPLETEGLGPRTATYSANLFCPIPSDSSLPHDKVDSVVVHGWGSSLCSGPSSCTGYVIAYLCVSYESVADGECTSMRLSKVRGANYEITFSGVADLYPWRKHPNGYPYIVVILPGPSFNGDTNTLRGITINGPSGSR